MNACQVTLAAVLEHAVRHLLATMSLGVNRMRVTAGLGSSEKVASLVNCKAGHISTASTSVANQQSCRNQLIAISCTGDRPQL